MSNKRWWRGWVVLAVLAVVTTMGFSVRAQSQAQVDLYALQTDSFPAMTAALDVFDASGVFVSGLTAENITVLEDDQPRPLDSLQELQPGVQFVLAINPGPIFAIRDSNAVSRYDKIAAPLRDWAAARPAESADDFPQGHRDDVSLVTTDGLVSLPSRCCAHMKSASDFLDVLAAYQPDSRAITPSLITLSRALDIAAEPTAQSGMKRAVLFITPLPEREAIPTLQSLTARAAQLKIRVYVWMVAPKDYFSTSGAIALQDLAAQTGGQAFPFSGAEALPDLETYLTPLRHTYALTYTSAIKTPGSHTLMIQVALQGQTASAAPLTFDLDVQPPNPILVSLPEQILRQSPDVKSNNLTAFAPTEEKIEIIVEFPDGHPRPLVRTTLYVDGIIADENTSEPFDKFTWNLNSYTSSGQHNLQVEAVDSLGLSKVSLGVPVTVTVVQPPRGLQVFLVRNSLWIAGGAVLLAGAALGLILFAGGRLRRAANTDRGLERKMRLDPLTQPISPRAEVLTAEKPGLQLPWARRRKNAPAYLVRLKSDGQPVTAPPIPLTGSEMTFGANPTQATHVLDDPSVSPLHARLKKERNGEFYLLDQNSIAGTWVNYEPVKNEPRRLKHGDILHLGQLSYRFMLRKPPEKSKPRIIQQK
ncbi:MAG: FHA domain-containing protein [Anaerolineales bacterium]|nr:FHA domain-containing protein [Anaerolineales bacterium]